MAAFWIAVTFAFVVLIAFIFLAGGRRMFDQRGFYRYG